MLLMWSKHVGLWCQRSGIDVVINFISSDIQQCCLEWAMCSWNDCSALSLHRLGEEPWHVKVWASNSPMWGGNLVGQVDWGPCSCDLGRRLTRAGMWVWEGAASQYCCHGGHTHASTHKRIHIVAQWPDAPLWRRQATGEQKILFSWAQLPVKNTRLQVDER